MDLNALMEELIHLDEIAGELSDEDNARVDQRRRELAEKIRQLVVLKD